MAETDSRRVGIGPRVLYQMQRYGAVNKLHQYSSANSASIPPERYNNSVEVISNLYTHTSSQLICRGQTCYSNST